jgi:DASS family divalent anion:Na+ symporter
MAKNNFLILLFGVAVLLLVANLWKPSAIEPNQWQILILFVGVVLAVLWNRYHVTVVILMSLAIGMSLGLMTTAQALRGYSSTVTWIIVAAFLFAQSFVKTGLGRRIALLFIRALGTNSLRLGYSLALTDAVLAPVTASNTARAGGITFPIARSLARELGSRPGRTARKIGGYLLLTTFQANVVTSALFLTSMAANGLSVQFAKEIAGVDISWTLWFQAAILPGIISLMVTPAIVYWLYPPTLTETPQATQFADNELKALGPMSQNEKILLIVFLVLATTWGTSFLHGISTLGAALAALSLLLLLEVLQPKDISRESSAWETFLWFGGYISLAGTLSDTGLMKGLIVASEGLLGSWDPNASLFVLVVLYMYLHYAFASMTAQIIALYSTFLTLAIAAGCDPLLSALLFCFFSSLYGCLTHYGDGAAPIFFGAGYIEIKDWWKVGFVLSLVHLGVWFGLGLLWWKLLDL